MKSIKASEFKAKCLQLMDKVAASGEELVITKNGKPVSRLVPFREKPESLYGVLRDSVTTRGDIISPVETDWNTSG